MMVPMSASTTARARARAEITTEITAAARRHIARDGAAGLSLRAVARDVGMVSSAVYRYFPSRDDLLTTLIVDAYDALGDAAERAEAAVRRDDLVGRWLAAAGAVRTWAIANPNEYGLIYGTPVPGYTAPQDTVAPATRVALVLATVVVDAGATGRLTATSTTPVSRKLRSDLVALRALMPGVPDAVILRAVASWAQLFGFVSFELFGQFENVISERASMFDFTMRQMAAFVGFA
jgi:AcrR family transcriptional regulator